METDHQIDQSPPAAASKVIEAKAQTDPRRRILDAAVRCFSREGFHGTSMHQICAEAQMSPGALYRYFPSKDAIIEAIAAEERQRNSRYLNRIKADGGLATFFETGFAFLRDVIASPEGALCAEVCAEARRSARVRAIFESNHRQAHADLKAGLAQAQARGEIDPGLDLDAAVTVLMAIGDGLVIRMPFEPAGTLDRLEPIIRELVGRMLAPPHMPGATRSEGSDHEHQ